VVDAGLAYVPGQGVVIIHVITDSGATGNYMKATVVSYDSANGSLIVDVSSVVGEGTFDSWFVGLEGDH